MPYTTRVRSDRWPDADEIVTWWLVGKPPEECQHDTSVNPIAPNCKPYMYECKFNCWSSVMKPSHWIRKPQPPIESKPFNPHSPDCELKKRVRDTGTL